MTTKRHLSFWEFTKQSARHATAEFFSPLLGPRSRLRHRASSKLDSAELDARVNELCSALAEAQGPSDNASVALEWFRDSYLARKVFGWNQNPVSRQSTLAEAIERGTVLTRTVSDSDSLEHPITMIQLNGARRSWEEYIGRGKTIAHEPTSRVAAMEAAQAPQTLDDSLRHFVTHSDPKGSNLGSEIERRPQPLEKPEKPG